MSTPENWGETPSSHSNPGLGLAPAILLSPPEGWDKGCCMLGDAMLGVHGLEGRCSQIGLWGSPNLGAGLAPKIWEQGWPPKFRGRGCSQSLSEPSTLRFGKTHTYIFTWKTPTTKHFLLRLLMPMGHSLGPLQMAAAKKRPHF